MVKKKSKKKKKRVMNVIDTPSRIKRLCNVGSTFKRKRKKMVARFGEKQYSKHLAEKG